MPGGGPVGLKLNLERFMASNMLHFFSFLLDPKIYSSLTFSVLNIVYSHIKHGNIEVIFEAYVR